MWNSFVGFFNKYVLDETVGPRKSKNTNCIYRDELSKEKSLRKLKDGDCFASSQPLLARERKDKDLKRRSYGGIDEKGVIRVRVVMTKEEAARLLSKCKEGGVLGFEDAANELVQIPVNRLSIVSTTSTSKDSVLESIPEEF